MSSTARDWSFCHVFLMTVNLEIDFDQIIDGIDHYKPADDTYHTRVILERSADRCQLMEIML